MKQIFKLVSSLCIVCALAAMTLVTACASTPNSQTIITTPLGGIPQVVLDARNNAPAGTLVGIGVAKFATTSQSRTIAAERARQEIAFMMTAMVMGMVRDYQAASEQDHMAMLAFSESIGLSLASTSLVGARIITEGFDTNREWWTVMYLDSEHIVKEITAAQVQARLAIPYAMSLDAERRMNEAIERALMERLN